MPFRISDNKMVWISSVPCFISVVIISLGTKLPHADFRLWNSLFDIFNVWVILSCPFEMWCIYLLYRSAQPLLPIRIILILANIFGIFLSIATLLGLLIRHY